MTARTRTVLWRLGECVVLALLIGAAVYGASGLIRAMLDERAAVTTGDK